MTVAEMRNLDRERISVREAAEVLGCSPQRLRDGLDIDDERPIAERRYLFPHCKVGNRRCIMREGFLRWVAGTMLMPDLPDGSPVITAEARTIMDALMGGGAN